MIRFLPDTWRDALLRPIAMAAPDGGVYIEIMAPDFRFAIAIILVLLLVLLLMVNRKPLSSSTKPALLLAGFITIAFVPWLVTSANGRYFIPFLLAVGPLCVGLIYVLPTTRLFRLSLTLVVVGLQGFAVQQVSPWQSWGLALWKDSPYFQVDWPADMLVQPADYVTLASISYSLVAPQLPARSRWMSLASAPPNTSDSADARRAQSFLSTARNLKLLVPAIPDFSDTEGYPTHEILKVIDSHLSDHDLALTRPTECKTVRSRGLASMALRREALADREKTARFAFWVCSLQRVTETPLRPDDASQSEKFDAVFRAIEAQCPRFFPPSQASTRDIPGGQMRVYFSSEMKVYVLDEGSVLYKYYRAFNPVRIGSRDDVISGKAKVDCGNIRGRSGLPWEREI